MLSFCPFLKQAEGGDEGTVRQDCRRTGSGRSPGRERQPGQARFLRLFTCISDNAIGEGAINAETCFWPADERQTLALQPPRISMRGPAHHCFNGGGGAEIGRASC